LEPYGWAAWSNKKGIITVRNPSERARTIGIEVGRDLELPSGAGQVFTGKDPFARRPERVFRSGAEQGLALNPFEVVTIELSPRA
jgi:hypothetical protein